MNRRGLSIVNTEGMFMIKQKNYEGFQQTVRPTGFLGHHGFSKKI